MIWRRRNARKMRLQEEAVRSRIRAEAQLARAKAQTPKYAALAESLRELRGANNFAAAIESSFRGGRE